MTLGIAGTIVFAGVFLISVTNPSYEKMARIEYGSRKGLEAIAQLYAKIEEPKNFSNLILADTHFAPAPPVKDGTTYRIPHSLLPAYLQRIQKKKPGPWNGVFAHFSDGGKLLAVEFYGSRYGCFVSSDRILAPSSYVSLVRLTDKPLCITIRITGEPEPND